MGTVHKTITLIDQQDARIASQIDAEQYTNGSEATRDLIWREQERRSLEIDTIRQALIEGEQRGKSQPFDFDDFLRRMNAENA